MSETPTERNRRIFEDATADGEPVFVLRAKDIYSIYAIEHYGALVAGGAGASFDPSFGLALDDIIDDFKTWRVKNAGKVKTPDLRS